MFISYFKHTSRGYILQQIVIFAISKEPPPKLKSEDMKKKKFFKKFQKTFVIWLTNKDGGCIMLSSKGTRAPTIRRIRI